MTITSVIAGAAVAAARPQAAMCALAAGGILLIGALQWGIRSQWDTMWPWPRIAAEVHAGYKTGDRVVVFGSGGAFSGETNAAAFYFRVPVVAVEDAGEMARMWEHERVYVVLPRAAASKLGMVPGGSVLIDTPLGWQLLTNRGTP